VSARHVFGLRRRSSLGFGDEEIISKNKETINNPAIAAPISIGDPISILPSFLHAGFHESPRLLYRQVPVSLSHFL
jgi:hypothetical protein